MADASLVHIVEDDDAMRDAFAMMLRVRGFRVRAFPSAVEFLEALAEAFRAAGVPWVEGGP